MPDIPLVGKVQNYRDIPNGRNILIVFVGLVIDRIAAVFVGQRIRLTRMINIQDRGAIAFDGLPRGIGSNVEVGGVCGV